MAILESDLKLLKSINMTNDSNGGGIPTNQVIADNVSNAIFDDVTNQDLVIGKVNERKVFLGVHSQNTDKVLSAMAFLTKIPKNENTTINLYRSESFFDTRADRTIKIKATNDTNPYALKFDNHDFNYTYAPQYNLTTDTYFSCFVINTISAGATEITVVGADGSAIGLDAVENSFLGVSGIQKTLQNSFVITDGTHTETIKVKSVTVEQYYLFGGSYGEIKSPYKRYLAKLTLSTPLINAYTTGANNTTTSTWLSSTTKLLTIGENVEKFYTAKPLKNAIAVGANSFTTTENINHVISVQDGTVIDAEILGIDASKFKPDGNYTAFSNGDMVMILNEIETKGTYATGQTVNLSRPNLAKVMLRDKDGAQISTTKYTADLKAGNVKMGNLTGVLQPITIIDRIEDLCLIKSNTGTTTTSTVTENVVSVTPATQTVTTTTKNALVTLTHAATMQTAGVNATILIEKPNALYVQATQDITGSLTPVVPTYFTTSYDVKLSTFSATALVKTQTEVEVFTTFSFYGLAILNTLRPWYKSSVAAANLWTGSWIASNVVLNSVVVTAMIDNVKTTLDLTTDYTVASDGIRFISARCLTAKSFVVSFNDLAINETESITKLTRDVDYFVDEAIGFYVLKAPLIGQVVTIKYDYASVALSFTATPLIEGTDFTVEPKKGLRFLTDQCLNVDIDVNYNYETTTPTSVTKTTTTTDIVLNRKLTRAYPVENTVIANCLSFGTLQASVSTPFDAETWSNVWADSLSGNPSPAQFNYASYPITVTNYSAIQERWAVEFVTNELVDVFGENVGVILSNVPISADIAPVNPATGLPYFTLKKEGWGANWSAGNVLRFNTKSATAPFWVMQSIKTGESTNNDFNFAIELRAEVDTVA